LSRICFAACTRIGAVRYSHLWISAMAATLLRALDAPVRPAGSRAWAI
jgi:hypothetical protein